MKSSKVDIYTYTYILLDLVMLKVLQYLLTEQGHCSQSCSCSQSWFTVTGSFSFQKRICLTALNGLTNTQSNEKGTPSRSTKSRSSSYSIVWPLVK